MYKIEKRRNFRYLQYFQSFPQKAKASFFLVHRNQRTCYLLIKEFIIRKTNKKSKTQKPKYPTKITHASHIPKHSPISLAGRYKTEMWVGNITLAKGILFASYQNSWSLFNKPSSFRTQEDFLEVHFLFSSHYSLEWRGMVLPSLAGAWATTLLKAEGKKKLSKSKFPWIIISSIFTNSLQQLPGSVMALP